MRRLGCCGDPPSSRRPVGPDATGCSALLDSLGSAHSIVHLPGASRDPVGDVVLADIAREDTSAVIDGCASSGSRSAAASSRSRSTRPSRAAPSRPSARLRAPRRRGRLGAGRGAHARERRALGQLPRVHGARDHDRCDRDRHRLDHPDHRRDGRRPRVRSARRALCRAGPAQAGSGAGGRWPRSSSASRSRSWSPTSRWWRSAPSTCSPPRSARTQRRSSSRTRTATR